MILWLVLLPFAAALVILPVRKVPLIAAPIAAATLVVAAILAVTAREFSPIVVLGRVLSLSSQERISLALSWLLAAVTILCTYRTSQQTLSYSLALGAIGLLTAAVMVRNMAIAALLLELGAILGAMLLPSDSPGAPLGGARSLALFVISGAMLLLASWAMETHTLSLEGQSLMRASLVSLVIGCGIVLAAGPLGIWLPPVFRHGSPLAAVLLSVILPTVVLLRLTDAAVSLGWSGDITPWTRLLFGGGVATCLFGGIGAIARSSARRITAYAAIADMGIILLAMGMGREMLKSASLHTIYRALAIVVLSVATQVLNRCLGNDDVQHLQGALHYAPMATIGMIIAGLSLAGWPPLTGFTSRFTIYRALADEHPAWTTALVIASLGPAWAYMRCALAAISVATLPGARRESLWSALWLAPLCLLLVALPYALALLPPEWMAMLLNEGVGG